MKTLLLFAFWLCLRSATFAQCILPTLTIDNLPATVCIEADPIPLVGYPSGGFFLINGSTVNFFEPSILGVGNHAVTYFLIYDPACPPVTLTQIVSVKPGLQIQGLDDTITCINPFVNLKINGSGPVTQYQWFGPSGFFSDLPSPSVDVPGNYFIIADNGGCSDDTTVVITENLLPPSNPVALGGTIPCNTHSLEITALSDVGDAQYLWLGPGGYSSDQQNPIVEAGGQYLVNITDPQNGCFVALSVEVLSAPAPDLEASVSGIITCTDSMAQLSASSNSVITSYQWQLPGGGMVSLQNISVNQPGEYIVKATDTAGCFTTYTILVEADRVLPTLSLQASGDMLSCLTKEIVLGIDTNLPDGEYTTFWLNSLQDTVSLTDIFTIITPGSYSVVVSSLTNGCSALQSVAVGIDTLAPISIASIAQPLCINVQGTLSGTGSLANGEIQYQWTSPDNHWLSQPDSANTEVESPGLYFLQVTDAENGCQSIDSVLVEPPIPFPGGVEIMIDQPSCIGNNGSISVNNQGGLALNYNFSGQGFDTLSAFAGLQPGDYTLEISEQGGCLYDTLLTLLNPSTFSVDIAADSTIIDLGQDVALQAIFNVPAAELKEINWYKNGEILCSACLEVLNTPLQSSIYSITAQTIDGCTATKRINITVTRSMGVYFGNVFSPNEDGLNDIFVPQFGKSIKSADYFQVYDRWGTLVYENNSLVPSADNDGWHGKIAGKLAPIGVYIYQISLDYIDGRREIVTGDVVLVR